MEIQIGRKGLHGGDVHQCAIRKEKDRTKWLDPIL